MDRRTLAEQKFRPLKKAMQQTFKRLRQAGQAGTLPEGGVVEEFIDQVRVMVSYPGFGDAAYPEFLAASRRLAACQTKADVAQFRETLATIATLQTRCHAAQKENTQVG